LPVVAALGDGSVEEPIALDPSPPQAPSNSKAAATAPNRLIRRRPDQPGDGRRSLFRFRAVSSL
jgi:hypothetical protein